VEGVIGQPQRDSRLGAKEGEQEGESEEGEAGTAHTCGHAVSGVQGCCCAEKLLPSHCQGREKAMQGVKRKEKGGEDGGEWE
jgi:hypothetical protein